jgi:hypothetical protein
MIIETPLVVDKSNSLLARDAKRPREGDEQYRVLVAIALTRVEHLDR